MKQKGRRNENGTKKIQVEIMTPYINGELTGLDERIQLLELRCICGMRKKLERNDTKNLNFAIAGCTVPGEMEVRDLKGSGLVIARYSIFYGAPSNYTGNLPEDCGYSLDMPKSAKNVRVLLVQAVFWMRSWIGAFRELRAKSKRLTKLSMNPF